MRHDGCGERLEQKAKTPAATKAQWLLMVTHVVYAVLAIVLAAMAVLACAAHFQNKAEPTGSASAFAPPPPAVGSGAVLWQLSLAQHDLPHRPALAASLSVPTRPVLAVHRSLMCPSTTRPPRQCCDHDQHGKHVFHLKPLTNRVCP